LFLGWSLGFSLFLELLLWSLGFALFLELLLWSLLWSLGLSLFLELLSALAVLQGSHFLLLIHLSRAKFKLWESFYHIAREVWEVSNLLGNYRHCEEQDSSLTLGTGSAIS